MKTKIRKKTSSKIFKNIALHNVDESLLEYSQNYEYKNLKSKVDSDSKGKADVIQENEGLCLTE